MKLQQMKFMCEIADRGFNISNAASALHTSQPSVSRQIQTLEKELGVAVFVRAKKRITGLTKPGTEVLQIARRIMRDTENLRHLGMEFTSKDSGGLAITTSHTHARYVLPNVIPDFAKAHPKVRVSLRQGNPAQINSWVVSGEADLSITSKPVHPMPDLAFLLCSEHPKVILTPPKHPLLRSKNVTTAELARYPIITYDPEFSTYHQVMRAFELKGLKPNIVLSATDVDVMKTYVICGLGVAILSAIAYDPKEDRALRAIDAQHLFESHKMYIGIRKGNYLRGYVFDFIKRFSPRLSREIIERTIFEDPPQT